MYNIKYRLKVKTLDDEGWIRIADSLPPVNEKVKLHTGDYEYIGTLDKDGEVWVCLGLSEEEEYYSNLDDGYITHWKPIK